MHDKYDSPHGEEDLYEEDPMDKAKETMEPIVETIKEKKMLIIGGIIAIVVLFFLYSFFIGSNREVSFNVSDTEGDTISASIKVSDLEGNEIQRLKSNEKITLKTGTYKIDVLNSDYKAITGKQIEITDNDPVEIEMEIDKDLELSGDFPQTLVTGQKTTIELTITSEESLQTEVELVLEGDAEKAMDFEYQKPIIANPGANQIIATIKVKSTLTDKDTGENKKATIRIKGLSNNKAKIQGKYTLIKFNPSDLKIKGDLSTKADFGKLDVGKTTEKVLQITNESDIPLNEITVQVDVVETSFTTPEDAEKWFSFNPSNTLSIDPDETQKTTIRIDVPKDLVFPQGTENEVVSGVVRISTDFYEVTRQLTFTVNKPNIGIRLSGLPQSNTLSERDGEYTSKTGFLEIKNSGETILTNFEVLVVCERSGTQWLTINNNKSEYTFSSLDAGKTQDISYAIDIAKGTPTGQRDQCNIGIYYDGPNGEKLQETYQVLISTK